MHESVATFTSPVELRPLQREEFRRFQGLLYERFGIDLRGGKEELVSARLSKRIREAGLRSFSEYLDYVTSDRDGGAMADMVDLLTTNHTSFFREGQHFDVLRRILSQRNSQNSPVRIWSAACSSGEEPYSIAITALEENIAGRLEILATDISTRVLKTAHTGIYPEDRVKNIPRELLRKYFLRGEKRAIGYFRLKPAVARHVTFHRLNLVGSYSHPKLFSMIWCRNVMIYFDKATQARVVNQLSEWLEPGGYLFIGHSEAMNGIAHSLRYVQPAVYQKW